MADRRNMSGVWYGRWTAGSRNVLPNRFIALIEEALGGLSGSISEPDLYGDVPVVHASLDGTREDARVAFVKQYDGLGRLSHAVRYEGWINAAGTEVSGRWSLSGYSGGFVMERETFAEQDLDEQVEADVPLPAV